tara:strand:- start:1134 stop:1385 length:252 start_codon:yes stop_codon:yes gene_type:complete
MATKITQKQADENYAQLHRLRDHEKMIKEWSRKNHIKDFMQLTGAQWKKLKKTQRQERRALKKAQRLERQGRQPQVAKTQSEI